MRAGKADGLAAPEGIESRRRKGESRGHHRGPRAGHVRTGVAWELERTVISL